jgi:hypothetical protein
VAAAMFPTTVELSRGDEHTITFHKDSYQDDTEKLTSSTSGWIWGNLLVGGVQTRISRNRAVARFSERTRGHGRTRAKCQPGSPEYPADFFAASVSVGIR